MMLAHFWLGEIESTKNIQCSKHLKFLLSSHVCHGTFAFYSQYVCCHILALKSVGGDKRGEKREGKDIIGKITPVNISHSFWCMTVFDLPHWIAVWCIAMLIVNTSNLVGVPHPVSFQQTERVWPKPADLIGEVLGESVTTTTAWTGHVYPSMAAWRDS